MHLMAELERLEHQLELARRALAMISDGATAARLLAFGNDIGARIERLKAECLEGATRRRAYQLWEKAGRPCGRDREFWLRAEREVLGGSDDLSGG
ncbi:hypothetical protein BST63_16810 [Bradyrhizobium canariense]|uniref:DUF2934 domain-containing protein n=2 Tax=Bradyrhizobium canariense TaxID=255045 RepID=A0ABX3X3C9_9BRAD|nr:hypothetical protein BSR47_19000 [Bradyrhizobium canariense]OSJ28404.1 hypothetical protein BST63_16810 [Bradyrhizobium canariense]